MKKVITVVMAIALFFSLLTPAGIGKVYAQESSTSDVKAQNEVSIDPPEDNTYEMTRFGWIKPAVKAVVKVIKGKKHVQATLKNSKVWKEIRNQHLAGKKHPVTGVLFDKNGFPIFNGPKFKLELAYWKSANKTQWNNIKGTVKNKLVTDVMFRKQFTQSEINQINAGNIPDTYRLHHYQDAGYLQLVHKNLHDKTGHTGGRAIWGEK